GNSNKAPFLFKLRYLSDSHSINHFINSQIEQTLESKFAIEKFWYLAKAKKIVIILDGFDEIATHATEKRRLQYFHELMPLMTASKHVVITSRPSYFRSLNEFNLILEDVNKMMFEEGSPTLSDPMRRDTNAKELADSHAKLIRRQVLGGSIDTIKKRQSSVYEILPFSEEKVIEYISKYKEKIRIIYKCSPKQLYESISKLYDLKDLLTTPLLLEMMLFVLIKKPLNLNDSNLSIGPAALYRNYVYLHLDRDWEKGRIRQYLNKDERLYFARGVAIAMLKNDNLEVSYEQVMSAIQGTAKGFSDARKKFIKEHIEEVSSDVQVCSFLTLKQENVFEFIHKSFMEYFVADYVQSGLSDRKRIPELAKNLNYETLYFLGGFSIIDANISVALQYQLIQFGHTDSGLYRRNIYGAILYSNQINSESSFSSCTIDYLRFKAKELVRCRFYDLVFYRCSFDETIIIDSQIDSLEMKECQSKNLNFFNCSGNVSLGNKISGLKINNCDGLACAIEGEVADVEISNSKLSMLGSKVEISSGSASEFALHFVFQLGATFQLKDFDFEAGVLALGDNTGSFHIDKILGKVTKNDLKKFSIQFERCSFINVTFLFMSLHSKEFLLAKKEGRLKNCKGVLLLDGPDISSNYFKTTEYIDGEKTTVKHRIGIFEERLLLIPNDYQLVKFVASRFAQEYKRLPSYDFETCCWDWIRAEVSNNKELMGTKNVPKKSRI
ncbi:MAG: NACHT domain-containing protein, partial [Bacteroidetes bacterium]|nr:NACHT domain-containing protein [Bacteroidota bacterium]